jgi:hypothetical protein
MERWKRCTTRGEGMEKMEKMVDVRLRVTAWRISGDVKRVERAGEDGRCMEGKKAWRSHRRTGLGADGEQAAARLWLRSPAGFCPGAEQV